MRVLTLTNWYPPHHFGGYELSCFDVMVRFEERGHEVHVLCGDTRVAAAAPINPDHEARVRRTLRLYHDGQRLMRPSWPARYRIERHNQRELRRAVEDLRPDVVSIWQLAGASHGLLAAVADAGVPVVFSVCDEWLSYGMKLDPWAEPFNRGPRRRRAGRIVERLVGVPCVIPDIGSLGPFLFVTRAVEETALTGSRWRPERRAVVWSGVDLGVFCPSATADTPPWRWRLITTGRFDPRKGFETAVRSMARLPPSATLACWGRGGDSERERLRGIAEELGIADRVSFGALEREQLPDQYRASDVMVFPSLWAEPFGLVPIEAMACGVPVVATGVGGSAEFLVDGTNCLLYPAGDAAALAAAVTRLAEDPGLRLRLVEGGLETAKGLGVDRLAEVMEAWHLYEAGGQKGPPPPDRAAPGEGHLAT